MKFGSEAKGDKPKPKGALAVMIASGPRAPSSSEPDIEVDEEAEPAVDHGFRAVAKAFGIPPERAAAAQAALHQYVMSCTGSNSEEPEEY